MFGALLESLLAFDVFRFGTAMPSTSCYLQIHRRTAELILALREKRPLPHRKKPLNGTA
jgi:hypothetical protein